MKTKRSSTGKSFPPLGPETKVFVVWVECFDDIGKNMFFIVSYFVDSCIHTLIYVAFLQ